MPPLIERRTGSAALILLTGVWLLFSVTGADTPLLTGQAAMGDWTRDAPGVRHRITVHDLPEPGATKSAQNQPKLVKRPEGAWPKVPDGFEVGEFARDLEQPRAMVTAPNGDLFVAESKAGRIHVFRDANHDGLPEVSEIFADGFSQPFGMAFYPPGPEPRFIYIANTDSIVRLTYRNGQTKAEGKPEELLKLPSGGRLTGGGHWTRDIVFSRDGQKLFVSVGSKSNNDDDAAETERARIFEMDPAGKNKRVFAGELWTSANERDELGDDLVPDYITRVRAGGFYGWPWFYLGSHADPKHRGKHPELADQVIVPDVLLQSHSASLCLAFYEGTHFPEEYRQNAFAAEHGSWNRSLRTGYKVIRIPTRNGAPAGEYIDFMTGFVTPDGNVWGRPVGVAVARDGALMVSDDGGDCIWRVIRKE
jgi:glucose/arabinose dehydrogenase